jgi:hypothetical protein
MKTFSAMSLPDKRLTMQAYEQLRSMYRTITDKPGNLPMEIREKILQQTRRLQQLMDALEIEILSE